MGFNSNYFKTFSGGLKVVQLNFNIVIIFVIFFWSWFSFLCKPLLLLSIGNVIFCVLIMLIRLTQNNQNWYRGLGKLEFGVYLVSTYLYINFSCALISILEFTAYNVAMVLGLLTAALYATDAFDKFTTHFMSIDNKSTCNDPRYPASNQNHPPPVYSQEF